MKGQRFFPLVVAVAGWLAYSDSFSGAFFHDDPGSILDNPTIRHLWPIWGPLLPLHGGSTVAGRPLANLSLAINYALGGYNVWGYHALNLAVHIFAALALFGVVRRTLLQRPLRGRFAPAAGELALATAVLWTIHPLQTESVTYIIQRTESIMGLFYLLTLYCFVRGTESPPMGNGKWFRRDGSWKLGDRLWYGLSVAACALGMASKEVMVSAPVMVLFYDRAFVSESLREAWRQRWALYLALASTWIVLGYVVVSAGNVATASTMARQHGLTWWQYLATQPGVILYYLRLSVWPYPLGLDLSMWTIAKTWMRILPAAAVIVTLLGATAWSWKRHPAWGFVGAWFFLILAPSSSFIPLNDLVFEHRMYLSLAAVVVLAVIGLYSLAGRRSLAVVALVAVGLGCLTWRRNQDYRSEIAFWSDAVAKFPDNPRARDSLAVALCETGRLPEALQHWERALELKPDFAEAHNNLGLALWRAGRAPEAIAHFERALRIQPDSAEAHNNLGVALMQRGQVREAMAHYERAVQIKPYDPKAHYNLGIALWQTGQISEAVQHWELAVRFKPDYAEAHNSLGNALLRRGWVPEAIAHYEQAVRIEPDFAEAHNNLGGALLKQGRLPEAIVHFQEAVQIAPDYAMAHYNLGLALEQAGRVPEAIAHYEQVLRIRPADAAAQNALARLRQSHQ
ncbi:MAG TPA: tetratricopeptide repeat protein [Verrucomicrobiae bacterium]|nr:tetratricopeptide repeat protein [Verrucomicrobiae bacterium]